MHKSGKPVRKCHNCLLNLGDHCWLYADPRGQWRGGKHCRAYGDEAVYEQFRKWSRQPVVKTRHELRRIVFRSRKRIFRKR